jgi:hypothetical protein
MAFPFTVEKLANAGVTLIFLSLVVYPVWSAYAGHPYPATPTIGLLCFAVPPAPRSTLIVPVLWFGIGAQAAFLVDVQPDLGLIVASLVGIAQLPPPYRPFRTPTS